jgi:hypothetical protein
MPKVVEQVLLMVAAPLIEKGVSSIPLSVILKVLSLIVLVSILLVPVILLLVLVRSIKEWFANRRFKSIKKYIQSRLDLYKEIPYKEYIIEIDYTFADRFVISMRALCSSCRCEITDPWNGQTYCPNCHRVYYDRLSQEDYNNILKIVDRKVRLDSNQE